MAELRYEADGLEGLLDRSRRPRSCPHQMAGEVEAVVLKKQAARTEATRRAPDLADPRARSTGIARIAAMPGTPRRQLS